MKRKRRNSTEKSKQVDSEKEVEALVQWKPPPGHQLKTIKDAADLFHSATFKSKIDYLLPHVRPKVHHHFEPLLHSLHSVLVSLPPIPAIHPLQAQKHLPNSISVPYVYPLPTPDDNWKVAFTPPENLSIALVGSWPNKLSVMRNDPSRGVIPFLVDLAVEMHPSLFQEKDYLNARFFQKRAFYLAVIAGSIQRSGKKSGLDVDLEYESPAGDPRLTTLILIPRKDPDISIRIIPTLSSSSPIPLHRLSPNHCNLRISSNPKQSGFAAPTPIYNSTLLLSFTPKMHLLDTHALLEDTPTTTDAFRDALTLLRVWANQRGYGEGARPCIFGFEGRGAWWAALLGLLVEGGEEKTVAVEEDYNNTDGEGMGTTKKKPGSGKRKSVGKGLSSYQLFKVALDFLAKHDWKRVHLFMKSPKGHRFPPEEYRAHHQAVFVDSSSLVNLLAGVPLGSLEMLQQDAKRSLEILDQDPSFSSGDPFDELFIKDQRDLCTRFDTLIRVDLRNARLPSPSSHAALDHGSPTLELLSSLARTLRRALGNRARAVALLLNTALSPRRRPTSQALPSAVTSPPVVYIGLVHHPQHALRLVDHGPRADDPDPDRASRFRDLWGDKAELRRFKDGIIAESVVWDANEKGAPEDRAQVPGMIVQHVLRTHFLEKGKGVETFQGSFDSLLRLPDPVMAMYSARSIKGGFKAALMAFDDLVKRIRALNDGKHTGNNEEDELPLTLSTVSPVSPCLRYTSALVPLPLPSSLAPTLPFGARYLPPMDIVLQFERSTRWPDDLAAIQRIKMALLERIADGLMKNAPGTRAVVALVPTMAGSATAIASQSSVHSEIKDRARLEIVTVYGWAFSARIWHDREVTLLDRIINDPIHPKKKHRSQPVDENNEDLDQVQGGGALGGVGDREHQEALQAKREYTLHFIHAPQHHRAVAAFCHRFSAYSGTVRLVKRWLAAHWLLCGDVKEEAVEILCAYVFGAGLSADRPSVPKSKERGFAEVVKVLMDWNWEEALFIPLYGDQDSEGVTEVHEMSTVGSGVWKLRTKVDAGGTVWTHRGPDVLIANRIHMLARATWEVLQGVEHRDFDGRVIFVHSQKDYDFTLNLNRALLPRYAQNANVDLTALSKRSTLPDEHSGMPRIGFDPAWMFFEDLKHTYMDTVRFFYDPAGGDVVGAVWNPAVKTARSFKIFSGVSTLPMNKEKRKGKGKGKGKDLIIVNENAVLHEMARFGSGIIVDVT